MNIYVVRVPLTSIQKISPWGHGTPSPPPLSDGLDWHNNLPCLLPGGEAAGLMSSSNKIRLGHFVVCWFVGWLVGLSDVHSEKLHPRIWHRLSSEWS